MDLEWGLGEDVQAAFAYSDCLYIKVDRGLHRGDTTLLTTSGYF